LVTPIGENEQLNGDQRLTAANACFDKRSNAADAVFKVVGSDVSDVSDHEGQTLDTFDQSVRVVRL